MELKRCTSCNQPITYENAKFCPTCGISLDESCVCECGFEYVGNFCPICGTAKNKKSKKTKKALVKKLFSIFATSFAIFVAVFSILSIFLI